METPNLNNLPIRRMVTSSNLSHYEEMTMKKPDTERHRAPGSGSVCQNPSGSWRAYVTIPSDNGGKSRRHSQSFPTKRQAEKWLRDQIREIENGLRAENISITLDNVAQQCLSEKRLTVKQSTLRDYHDWMDRYISPHLGNRPIRSIKPIDISRFYTELIDSNCSESTVSHIHSVLRLILQYAVKHELLSANPALRASHPSRKKTKQDLFLTPDQSRQLINELDCSWYQTIVCVALATGMRSGEIRGLTWDKIDFEYQTIRVSAQMPTRKLAGQPRELESLKTRSSYRTLRVGPKLIEMLKQHRARINQHAAFKGSAWKESGLIFTSRVGTPMDPSELEKTLKAAFRSLGLDGKLTFHHLRHTAASFMLAYGIPVHEVSRYLGHASTEITLNVYGHVIPQGKIRLQNLDENSIPSLMDQLLFSETTPIA
jgi:integrase